MLHSFVPPVSPGGKLRSYCSGLEPDRPISTKMTNPLLYRNNIGLTVCLTLNSPLVGGVSDANRVTPIGCESPAAR